MVRTAPAFCLRDALPAVSEAKVRIQAMEDELDQRKAAVKEEQISFQAKAVEGLKDALESFGPNIAVHLTTALEDSGLFDGKGGGGGGGGGAASQEVLTMLEALSGAVEGSKGKVIAAPQKTRVHITEGMHESVLCACWSAGLTECRCRRGRLWRTSETLRPGSRTWSARLPAWPSLGVAAVGRRLQSSRPPR